jgi:hypothetical protein
MTADTAAPALTATARNVMDRIRYVVLDTIDEDGCTRTSPVYFVPHRYRDLYWVSTPTSHHSHNLKRDNRLSAVIFDSTVPPGPDQQAVPDGGETIPLSGFAVVTGFFSVVGIVIAAGALRWSARPAERFVRTAVSLTAISLVPPLLSGANTATTTALIGLHLVSATVMIPTLARSLRTRTD